MNRLYFYAVMIVLQLLLAEALLQAYYRITVGDWLATRVGLPIFQADEVRGYRVQSNISFRHLTSEFDVNYQTDSEGLRSGQSNKRVLPAKPDNVFRIILTGPSFAFGVAGNYEEIYARLIEQELRVPGKEVEIINIGTPGQPPNRQMCWIEQIAPQYNPDMVIQTIYGEIDLVGTACELLEKPPVIEDGYLLRERATWTRKATEQLKQSALIFYTWYIYQTLSNTESKEGLGLDLYNERDTSGINPDGREVIADANEKFTANRALISNALGQETLVAYLYVPYSFVVRPADLGRWSHISEKARDADLQRRQATELTRKLRDEGVIFVNATPALIERDQSGRTYNYLDIHFTPAGNRAAADAFLVELNDKFPSGPD